jgi:hypothetical protein
LISFVRLKQTIMKTIARKFLAGFVIVSLGIFLPEELNAQQQSPALEFPVQGLDDMAAYRDYQTRFYRDTSGTTIQVVLNQAIGRVVNLWADASNESMSFSVRDSSGKFSRVSWDSPGARASQDGVIRTLDYTLTIQGSSASVGHLLLGSMRKERDFQYARREFLPFDSLPPVEPELQQLVADLRRLPANSRREFLSLLRATNEDEVVSRMRPHIGLLPEDGRWKFTVRQRTFDGLNHLLLQLSDDTVRSRATMANGVLTVRALRGNAIALRVRIGTDSPALTPLTRDDIFTSEFQKFYRQMQDQARERNGSTRDRFNLLERQVRSMELLSFKEKLMAGLPNYATYFGRDMMMSAMMLESVMKPAMQEHVISAVLRKLSPEGKVSHEEALGGQAIRENAGVFNTLIESYMRGGSLRNSTAANRSLAEARALLPKLQRTREDYHMVDETFQLPVIVARYLSREDVPLKAKKAFLLDTLDGSSRVSLLMRNLHYVEQSTAPFAAKPDALNLVSFPRGPAGTWLSASWRDSGAGYAGGRFAMDVNTIWVPSALAAMKAIFTQFEEMGISKSELMGKLPDGGSGSLLGSYISSPSDLDDIVQRWEQARRFFRVGYGADEIRRHAEAKLSSLPDVQRAYWQKTLPTGVRTDSVIFPALSLDSLGSPIPVMNSDPATWLFLANLSDNIAKGTADTNAIRNVLKSFVLPFPVGLFIPGLGALVANDAYAAPDVWSRFEKDQYHSPRVVWGREVNLIMLGAMKLIRGLRKPDNDGDPAVSASMVRQANDVLNSLRTAVDTSGMKQNELWTYKIEGGALSPARYEFSCDVQLWNLTDLAVQYEYEMLQSRGQGTEAGGR